MRRVLVTFFAVISCLIIAVFSYADIIKKTDDLLKKKKNDIVQKKCDTSCNLKSDKVKISENNQLTSQSKTIQLHIWFGACKYLPDMLTIVKSFMDKHKEIEYHFYIVETDEKFDMKALAEQMKDLTFELDFNRNPKELPYFVFFDGNKEYTIAGLVDLEEALKEFAKSTNSINKGIQGRHCKAVYNNNQTEVEKPELPNITNIVNKSLKEYITKLPHNKKERYIKTEGTDYLPFKKFYIVSSRELSLIESDSAGCCIDCTKTNEKIQLCPKELLERFNVKSTPTIVYFQK